MRECCPTCGRPYPTARRSDTTTTEASILARAALDTSAMTDSEVRAHYLGIAPLLDVQALRDRADLSPDLHRRVQILYQLILDQRGKHTTASKAEYKACHQQWRRERNADDPAYRFGSVGPLPKELDTRGIEWREAERRYAESVEAEAENE
jgi:hypothetical protein